MDVGKGKSCHFKRSQALANQVVRKAEISAPVVGGLLPVFHPLSSIAEIGHSAKVLHHGGLAPVILDPEGYDLWLDPGMKDVAAASGLLKPCDARLMRCYPHQHSNQSRGQRRRERSAPVELAQIQNWLFL